ncbi:MAG TPA: hypothetical protein VL970_02175, partial [Candidatus Acidoferrales bacterium]|nr:hypothetical protein [Candidatus Acidoferrales bacterium]
YQHASQVKTAVDTIAGTTAPPPVSDAAVLAREILARDYKLNIRSCVRRAWKLLKGEFWPFVGVSALFLALFGFASSFGATTIQHTTQSDSTVEIMSAVALLVFGPLWGGLFLYILKKIRLEPATIETAFSGFNKQRFLHLFLAGFATAALTWLGFLLILPGIYLFVAWMFTLPIVVDKQIDFWSAMELSRKIVTRHWFKLLGFGLVLWLLLSLGVLALVIGILVMFPLVLCTLMYAYEDIFGKATGMAPAPAPAATGPAGTIVMPTVPVQPSHRETWTPATKIGLALVAVLVLVAMVWMVFLAAYRLRPSHREADNQFTKIVESKQQTAPAETPGPEPPPVPVAASEPAAASSAAMAGAAPAFAPVIELELTNRAAVNLASGEQKALPQYLAEQTRGNDKDMAIVAWMEGADMDVAYVDGSGYSMMAGWASENRDSWNKTNPDSVAAALQKTGRDMGNKLYGTGLDSSTNYTYGFQTRSGHLGLLQFVDFTNESPPYVSIRYQLVEPAASPATIPGAAAGMSPSVLAERLEAAAGITDPDQKDKPLAALAADAAKAGQVLLAKEALADMYNVTARDAATQAAAVLLAKHGLRKSAIEMAKGITDTTVRDQTLAELAQ